MFTHLPFPFISHGKCNLMPICAPILHYITRSGSQKHRQTRTEQTPKEKLTRINRYLRKVCLKTTLTYSIVCDEVVARSISYAFGMGKVKCLSPVYLFHGKRTAQILHFTYIAYTKNFALVVSDKGKLI